MRFSDSYCNDQDSTILTKGGTIGVGLKVNEVKILMEEKEERQVAGYDNDEIHLTIEFGLNVEDSQPTDENDLHVLLGWQKLAYSTLQMCANVVLLQHTDENNEAIINLGSDSNASNGFLLGWRMKVIVLDLAPTHQQMEDSSRVVVTNKQLDPISAELKDGVMIEEERKIEIVLQQGNEKLAMVVSGLRSEEVLIEGKSYFTMKELVRCVAKGVVYPEISLFEGRNVVEDWSMTPFGERKLDAALLIDRGGIIRKRHAESVGIISDETAHQNLSTTKYLEAYIMHRPSFVRKASGTNDG